MGCRQLDWDHLSSVQHRHAQGAAGVRNETARGGLYLMGARWYDPQLGRFISQDPMGFQGGLNLYNYGNADPVSRSDESGLAPRKLDPGTEGSLLTAALNLIRDAGDTKDYDYFQKNGPFPYEKLRVEPDLLKQYTNDMQPPFRTSADAATYPNGNIALSPKSFEHDEGCRNPERAAWLRKVYLAGVLIHEMTHRRRRPNRGSKKSVEDPAYAAQIAFFELLKKTATPQQRRDLNSLIAGAVAAEAAYLKKPGW